MTRLVGNTGQFQNRHKRETPLTPAELEKARADEAQRQRWDPSYVTAKQAEAMPQEVAERPDIQDRIRYSQPDWPENRMAASEALKDIPTGAGETVERRAVSAADLMDGTVRGGVASAAKE